MARKTFKKGGATRYDTGGDIFKTPPAAGPTPNPDIFKPEKAPIKFVSNPVVQDISKIDRAKSDKGIPTTPPKSGGSFGAAFKAARADPSAKTFTWNGKSYSTALKGAGGGGGGGGGGSKAATTTTKAADTGGGDTMPWRQHALRAQLASQQAQSAATRAKDAQARAAAARGGKGATSAAAPAAAKSDESHPFAKDSKGAYLLQGTAGSRARGARLLSKATNLSPAKHLWNAASKVGSALFSPADAAEAKAARRARNAEKAKANTSSGRFYRDNPDAMAKGGRTGGESPAMVKKEVDFFKKKKAPPAMIKHEEAELKQSKGIKKSDNPFASANSKAEKKGGNPFAKGKNKNPFAKADGKKGKPFPAAKSKPKNAFGFAKGGKIDGCAVRGRTKCKRT